MLILVANLPFLFQNSAHAATNANLFVSAENSQWNNYFAGPQVIQVVVADPDINRLDQAYGEPFVTVNGKRLRMAQNTDGNWYAYFADRNQAIAADKTVGLAGKGLDFGQFCASTSTTSPSFTDTKGFTVARVVTGSVDKPANSAAFGACTDLNGAAGPALEHVVRQNKTLTHSNGGITTGQIGLGNAQVWPIIQLYDFAAIPSSVTVDYTKNGGDQIVNLTFDRIPQNLISTSLDRASYAKNTPVLITLNDPQLNIDPTEEDSWTWGSNAANNTLYYQAFDRNGGTDADGTAGMQNLIGNLTSFLFNHNGKLTINPAFTGSRVIDFQGNGIQLLNGTSFTRGDPAKVRTSSIGLGSEPITFIEKSGINTGVFGNWRPFSNSDVITVDDNSIEGQNATMRYNDVTQTIVGGVNGNIVKTYELQIGDSNGACEAMGGIWNSALNTCTLNTALTLNAGDSLTLDSGTALVVNGILSNAGTITNAGGIENMNLGKITNSGIITNSWLLFNDGTITNLSGGAINNNGGLGITNNGGATLNNLSGGTITNSNDIENNSNAAINNAGTIINKVGGTINNYHTGTIVNVGGGTLVNSGTINNKAGTLSNHTGGIINNSFGGIIMNAVGGTVVNSGIINNNLGGNIANLGTINNNSGTINNNSGATFSNQLGGIINNNAGTIGNFAALNNFGTITNNSGGILDNSSSGTLANYGTINNNAGTIKNHTGGVINNSGTVTPSSPAKITIATGAGASSSAGCVSTNNCFLPNPRYVSPGTTVTWINTDSLSHTITSGKISDGNAGSLFDSGLVKKDQEFKFTFATAGAYNYFCAVHPWMIGQVIVGSGGKIDNSSGNTIFNSGIINNDQNATISNHSGATISNSGTINNTCGGIIKNSGTISNHTVIQLAC